MQIKVGSREIAHFTPEFITETFPNDWREGLQKIVEKVNATAGNLDKKSNFQTDTSTTTTEPVANDN